MDSKLINGLFPKKGNQEWKVVSIGVRVEEFAKELIRLKDHAAEKKGFINIDVCMSKDGTKMYTILDDFIPNREKVTASDHSPDRNESPF
tara:strand:- start:395 stop:664 length:270 start_codon:yes stop_codon:yes gene_type:complete